MSRALWILALAETVVQTLGYQHLLWLLTYGFHAEFWELDAFSRHSLPFLKPFQISETRIKKYTKELDVKFSKQITGYIPSHRFLRVGLVRSSQTGLPHTIPHIWWQTSQLDTSHWDYLFRTQMPGDVTGLPHRDRRFGRVQSSQPAIPHALPHKGYAILDLTLLIEAFYFERKYQDASSSLPLVASLC